MSINLIFPQVSSCWHELELCVHECMSLNFIVNAIMMPFCIFQVPVEDKATQRSPSCACPSHSELGELVQSTIIPLVAE